MLSAPLSTAWIVAVYLPAKIVAVGARAQHRILIMKLYHKPNLFLPQGG
jgi:hypothetical protein